MKTNWTLRKKMIDIIKQYPNQYPLVTQILYHRNLLKDNANYNTSPFILKDMILAVPRIKKAIAKNERILIYGDFDADGITSTVALYSIIKSLKGNVIYYIPDRTTDGYGIKRDILLKYKDNVSLIITVDCGITAVDEIKDIGIDMIITDHHMPKQNIPKALAVINPNRKDCQYPSKNLAGVGVVFKLIQALTNNRNQDYVLDLAALGTIADVMTLTGENRAIVRDGLQLINNNPRPGIKALLAVNNRINQPVTAETISFLLAPCINAVSRVGADITLPVQLLLTNDYDEAEQLARQLHKYNKERKTYTLQAVEKAKKLIEKESDDNQIIIIKDDGFQSNISGLACNMLIDKYKKPIVIISDKNDIIHGSIRSYNGFNAKEALQNCNDVLLTHGGHIGACGFSLQKNQYNKFKSKLISIANEQIKVTDHNNIIIDGEVNLKGITEQMVEALSICEPFGQGNPKPLFLSNDLLVKNITIIGDDKTHLKLILNDGKNDWVGIGFGLAKFKEQLELNSKINILYHFDFNYWQGQKTLQLILTDIDIKTP